MTPSDVLTLLDIDAKGRVIIPGKPGHRIVLMTPEVAMYENVETGERTPIAFCLFDEARVALSAIGFISTPVPLT